MPIVTATGLHAEAKPLLPVHRFQRVGLIRLLGTEAHDDGQEQAAKEVRCNNHWRYTGTNQALGTVVLPQNA